MSCLYRKAERALYTYPVNMMRMYIAMNELRELSVSDDCHAQSYGAHYGSEGTHSDPPGSYASRVISLEGLIMKLEAETDAVSVVRGEVKNSPDERYREMFLVMEGYYFERTELKELAESLGKSERTLRRRREELIHKVMDKLEG